MKAVIAIALASLAVAATLSVRADDLATFTPQPFTSTLSRAEVMAELEQFRRAGIDPWADQYDPLAGFRSERSRDEVMSEYLAGRATVAAFTGEDSGSVYLARQPQAPAATQHAGMQE